MDEQRVDTFERSLSRCLHSGDFITAFYDRFLASSDEVRGRFSATDFERQKGVLKSSLYLMARAALGLEDGRHHLRQVALSHSRRGLDITPHLYDHWLESLVACAREFDAHFDSGVESAWRDLLGECISTMVEVYRQSVTAPPGAPPAPESA